MNTRPSVLFVCLGNICRSPLAEAAFRKEAEDAGLDVEIDSAGTGHWHAGKPPDPRAQAIALANGIDISHYRARQLEAADFARFSHIFAMDYDNLAPSRRARPRARRPRSRCCSIGCPGGKGPRWPIPITAGKSISRIPGRT